MQCLINTKPHTLPWRAGGTDSSDGLLAAVEGLCKSSGCGAVLDPDQLPRAQDWPQGQHWDRWCLSGGEDFQLVLSLPLEWAENWLAAQPGSRRFGMVTAEEGLVRWTHDATPIREAAFNHY